MPPTDLPTTKRRRQKIDPFRAFVERNLVEGLPAILTYARQQEGSGFWPLGLCIAWVLGRELSQAAEIFARHRAGMEHGPGSWPEALDEVVRGLQAGTLVAVGIRTATDVRVWIPTIEWLDLSIVRRGFYNEVWRLDARGKLSPAYYDVRIVAKQMRKEWPAETAAKKRARERLDTECACFENLKQRMREKPNEPVAKKTLAREFHPAISERAFNRCYAQAVRETGAVAWTKAGRRRRQPSDSPESSESPRTGVQDRQSIAAKSQNAPAAIRKFFEAFRTG
jgi:hypothetical protein